MTLAPAAAGLHCNLGLALQQLQRHDEALACYDRALALRPDSVEALNNKGNTLRELKRLDAAVECYELALKIRPGLRRGP